MIGTWIKYCLGLGLERDRKEVGGRKAYLKTFWLWFRVTSATFQNQSLIPHTRTFSPLSFPIIWLMIWQSCWTCVLELWFLFFISALLPYPGPGKHDSVTSKLVIYFIWGWKGSEDRWLHSDSMCICNILLSMFGTLLSTQILKIPQDFSS